MVKRRPEDVIKELEALIAANRHRIAESRVQIAYTCTLIKPRRPEDVIRDLEALITANRQRIAKARVLIADTGALINKTDVTLKKAKEQIASWKKSGTKP